jgi:serum/glucocorticoid-regulated kinase 2
MKSKPMSS